MNDDAERDLMSLRTATAHERQHTKVLTLGALNLLTGLLSTAQDAATSEVPSIIVVREQVERALDIIRREVKRLRLTD